MKLEICKQIVTETMSVNVFLRSRYFMENGIFQEDQTFLHNVHTENPFSVERCQVVTIMTLPILYTKLPLLIAATARGKWVINSSFDLYFCSFTSRVT